MHRAELARAAAIAALAIAAATAGAPRAHAGAAITVARQATVSGEVVTLAEVAHLTGDALALADVELGRAPAAGEGSRLSGEGILRRLRQAGLDEASTVYTIPAWVRVVRAFQEVPEQELREAVRGRVEEMLAPGESIEEIAVPEAARVPLGGYAIEVDEPRAAGATTRARRADVRILQAGEVVARVPVRVAIAAVGPVVVARNAIERGAIVRAEDVVVEERSLAGLPPNVLGEPAEVVGRQARVSIAAGRPIGANALAVEALVRKGDAVRLQIESGALRLSASGQALEDAGAGEPVRVLNPSSGREITGKVMGHGIVVVAQ